MASVMSGVAPRIAALPCRVSCFRFLLPPDEPGKWALFTARGVKRRCSHLPDEPGKWAFQQRHGEGFSITNVPLWTVGEWSSLGEVSSAGRVGADLSVVQRQV